MRKKWKSILEGSSYLVLIVLCTFLLYQHLADAPPTDPQGLTVGETYEALQAVVPAGAESAWLLALNPNCSYCDESMSFYQTLLQTLRQKNDRAAFVAVVAHPDFIAGETATLIANGVAVDTVVKLAFKAAALTAVPAIIQVHRAGHFHHFWPRFLHDPRHAAVLQLL